ncbi:MAG: 2-oxoglutarate oxidoreductase, partial [Eubacteriales bacterium]|nr:2-oxoglutarate oxidoreductase [Eubacteriales bacterium]
GKRRRTICLPLRMSEMLATIDGAAYIERVTVTTPANIMKAKRSIKKAFELQIEGLGFTMIEVLSTCPTNWGLTPIESLDWVKEHMLPVFPLGIYRDVTKEEA